MSRTADRADEGEGAADRPIVLRLLDGLVVALFLAAVMLAALPMGANRDWAWSPIVLVLGIVAVLMALGLGVRRGFEVAEGERLPLLILIACFAAFVAFALIQMSPLAPASGSAWLYADAARILGRAHAAVPDLAVDAARNTLLKCIACGLIFLIARAISRDPATGRLLLMLFVASAVLVMIYALIAQVTTRSCYLGAYLKKQAGYAPTDVCVMSGTFVNSNSFGCYCGMGVVATIALMFSSGARDDRSERRYSDDDGRGFLDWLTGPRLVWLAIAFFLLGGLMFSASRAAFAATGVGAFVLGLLLMRGYWRSRPDYVRIFVAAVALALVIGLIAGGALLDKLARGEELGARLIIWSTAFEAVRLSPWFGWGLGSFGDIYTILQPPQIIEPNDLAHSTPIETIVEVGAIMALPTLAIVALPWAIVLRGALVRRRRYRYLPAAAFTVAGVAIVHSLIDFSLQMPAIGFVVSALLGMGWAQAFGRRSGGTPTAQT